MNTCLPSSARRKSQPAYTLGKAISHVYTSHRTKHVLVGHAGMCGTRHTYRSSHLLRRRMFAPRDRSIQQASHPPAALGTRSWSSRLFRPWDYHRHKHVLGSHADARGRFRGIKNMGQQLYVAADIPYGLNPSVDIATATLLGLPAFSGYFCVNFCHVSPSDGCIIFFLRCLIPSRGHLICWADSSFIYILWILGRNGRYRRIFWGTPVCLFWPSPASTSKNLEDLQWMQYFPPACFFLNSMHSFGQASIFS